MFINHAMSRETKGATQKCESAEVEQSAVCTCRRIYKMVEQDIKYLKIITKLITF